MKRIVVFFLFGMVFIGMAFSQTQEGRGTWYETDSKGLAASHANLPFGTRVRVTNLQNDRQVIVTINNRIVDTPNRIIDISKAAADNLEMSDRGTTPVRIEVLSRRRPAEPETPPTQTVEVPEPEPEPPPPQVVEEPKEEPVVAAAPVRQPQEEPRPVEPPAPQPAGQGGNVTQTIITINGMPYGSSDSAISASEGAQVVAAPAPAVVAPAPAVVSPNPAVVAPNPAVVAPSPVTVSPNPVVVSPAPAIISPVVVPPIVAQPVLAQPILTPPVLAPPVVSPPIVSEPIVSQPIVSPTLVSPTVTAEPVISTPTQVQPMISSAQTLTPQMVTPQTLTPQTMTPQMMSPQTLPAQTPQAPLQQGGQPARVLPRMPAPGSPGVYVVQVGAFMSEQNAMEAYRRVAATGLQPSFERYGDYIRVVVSGLRAADLELVASRLGSVNFREVLIRESR